MGIIGARDLFTLELSGEPYDRGHRYGEARRALFGRMSDEQFFTEFQGKVSKDQLLKHARKYEPFISNYSSEIEEELRGMADGSGLSYDEIVMINALEEREAFTPHCTAFAVTGKATKGGETYAGQTWDGLDSEWWDGDMGLLLKVRRKNGPDILDYTNPGLLACAGLNSKGISINWNTVPQREFAAGVPTYLIVAEVLKQPTIDDALHAVRRAHRAGYFNFVIADETELYNVEGTPKDLDISHSTDIIGHANHFASERFRSTQNVEVASCSLLRHDRINALLKENFGSIDLGKSMEFVRDHVNYPLSICRHPGDEPDPKERGLTLDSWISVPAKKELWICHGSPCENEFVRFGF